MGSLGAGPARKDVLGVGHLAGCIDNVQHTKTPLYPQLHYAFISKIGETATFSLLCFQFQGLCRVLMGLWAALTLPGPGPPMHGYKPLPRE